jgi:hypothetical protein
MSKKNLICLFILIFLLTLLPNILPLQADQTTVSGQIQTFGQKVYGSGTPAHPAAIAAVIIQSALGLLGIIFVVLVIYGGFMYMTSAGESDKVKKAKNIILYAAIGVIIIFLAYALTTFIFNLVLRTTQGGSGIGAGPSGS